jgi:hypothetical protein
VVPCSQRLRIFIEITKQRFEAQMRRALFFCVLYVALINAAIAGDPGNGSSIVPEIEPQKPWQKDEKCRFEPASLSSTKLLNLENHTAIQQFDIQIRREFSPDLEVVSDEGYVLEEIIFDTGETIRSDWQQTTGLTKRFQTWAGKAQRSAIRPISIGRSSTPANGISKLKGYIAVKTAESVVRIEVASPLKYIGKSFDNPKLKELGFYLMSVEETKVVIQHPFKEQKYLPFRTIQFLNAKREIIPWRLEKQESIDNHEFSRVTLKLDAAFDQDGTFVFELYENIVVENLPFIIKDLTLKQPPSSEKKEVPIAKAASVKATPAHFILMPHTLTFIRSVDCIRNKEGVLDAVLKTNFLGLQIEAEYPKELLVIGKRGWFIEKAITDAGEELIPDIDESFERTVPLASWELGEQTPEELQFFVKLGRPAKEFNGVSLIRGYCAAKCAEKLKSVEVKSPEKWVGKLIDVPGLSELGFTLVKFDKQKIVIRQRNSAEVCSLVHSLAIVNSAGKELKWECNGRSEVDDGKSYEFEIITTELLTNEAILRFVLYEGVRDEIVPFEIKNAFFFAPSGAKPPAPPPDF